MNRCDPSQIRFLKVRRHLKEIDATNMFNCSSVFERRTPWDTGFATTSPKCKAASYKAKILNTQRLSHLGVHVLCIDVARASREAHWFYMWQWPCTSSQAWCLLWWWSVHEMRLSFHRSQNTLMFFLVLLNCMLKKPMNYRSDHRRRRRLR